VRIRVRNPQDLLAGLFFLAIAGGALWVAWDYPTGTAVRMSSGYFPRLLCLLLAVIGLFVALRSLVIEGPALTAVRLRPVLLITAAVVAFAYSIQTLGLVAATALITLIGGFASPRARLIEMAAAAVVLGAMATAVFIWGIGLPIPIWPEF
jgi:putative tricarboxylic transport membrane protein